MDHPLVPVLVDLVRQGDDVALLEAQLAVVLGLEVVEGFAAGLVQGGCGDSGDTSAAPHTALPWHQGFLPRDLDPAWTGRAGSIGPSLAPPVPPLPRSSPGPSTDPASNTPCAVPAWISHIPT